jgi:endonuclease YncB( thermonuclease family)
MGGWDEISRYLAAAGLLAFAAVLVRPRLTKRLIRRAWRNLSPLFGARNRPRSRRWRTPARRRDYARKPSPSSAPFTLTRFWVVDGDTIRDNATKTVYRLENIDCPETEERAKCFREREQGKRAKFEAVRLLKGAVNITVRPTGKIDDYGRSIAMIDVDGADFGQLMIGRGLARPWRGVREDWCGPNGGLARMAEACSARLHCQTCGGRANIEPPRAPAAPQSISNPE